MPRLYANPYDTSKTGFYFEDAAEYDKKEAKHSAEEFEIDFIDGSDSDQEIFEAMEVSQSVVGEYFDVADQIDTEEEAVAFAFLMDVGLDAKDAADRVDEVQITEGTPEDYAYEYVESVGMEGLGKSTLEMYFDYEAFGRDLSLNGDITEWDRFIIGNPQEF